MVSLSAKFYEKAYTPLRFGKVLMFNDILKSDDRFIKLRYIMANKLLADIEIGCYEGALETMDAETMASFREAYHFVCYNVGYNLDNNNNPNLLNKIFERKLNPKKLGHMSAGELCPENFKDIYELLERRNGAKIKVKVSTIERCRVCGKNMCTYQAIQTRSLDEENTIFYTCVYCSSTWKS